MLHPSRSRRPHSSHWLTLILLATPAAAQRTWIVDATGGPGSDFRTLSAAFASAAEGDTIRVRRGNYLPGTLATAVRLVFETNALVGQARSGPAFVISNVRAGTVCSIRGLRFSGTPLLPDDGVRVHDCAGTVVFDGCAIRSSGSTTGSGLELERCASVALSNSTVEPAVLVRDSALTASATNFIATPLFGRTAAIRGIDARIELSDCSAFGTGSHGGATPALQADRSSVVIRGDATSEYRGGTYIAFVADAIEGGTTSSLTIDPAVRLSSPPVGMTQVVERTLPRLRVQDSSTTLDVTLTAAAGSAFGLLVALPAPPIDTLLFGTWWLDSATTAQWAAGIVEQTGAVDRSIRQSASASTLGLPLVFQAVVVDGRIELSSAAAVVID